MRNAKGDFSGLAAVMLEYLKLVVLTVAVPLMVAVDVLWLEHGIKEKSVTELAQKGLLLLSALLIGLSARRHTESRGFLVLVAGLFAAMFIREADVYFDMVAQGSWLYPALAVSLLAIVYASRQRGTVIAPLIGNLQTKSFNYIMIGLILVVLFSRLFGTGQLWREVMGEDYRNLYKSMIQEGLELLGYVLICFGSVRLYLRKSSSA
jgi:hypothetical protein